MKPSQEHPMASSIKITVDDLEFEGELNDTSTAGCIYDALPIENRASRWGDEIYFSTPVKADKNDPTRDEMAIGELAFWPQGRAFCIFWGPTPASIKDEPRAVSPVVPIGRLRGEIALLSRVADGQTIRVERAD